MSTLDDMKRTLTRDREKCNDGKQARGRNEQSNNSSCSSHAADNTAALGLSCEFVMSTPPS